MEHYLGELAALATSVLWTLSILAWTSAGREIGALVVSFIRLWFASAFLLIYGQIAYSSAWPAGAPPWAWLLLGSSGFFGLFLADVCLFKACLVIGPRLTLLVNSLTPVMAAILAWVWLGEALTLRHWLAMLVTLAGICWVVLERSETEGLPRRGRTLAWGIILTVFATVGQAVGSVLAKEGLDSYPTLDTMAAAFIRTLGAVGGYLPLITLACRWPAVFRSTRNGRAMLVVTFGAFVGPFLGVATYLVALQHCHVGIVTTLTSMMPVFILPFVIVLYREKVSLRAACGAILSVVGVALLVL